MKNSGIEWIGEIPADWKLIRGKNIFSQRSEKGNDIELQLLSPTQKYGVIPQKLYEELSGMKAVKLDEDADLSLLKTTHVGDYCISLRSFQGGFEYSGYEGVVSPAYQIFYPIIDVDRGYYKYMFKDKSFIAKMNSYTLSLRDGKNIAFSDFADSLIPYPTIVEQKEIASFLDSQCAHIDTVIEKTKESIEEYKKLKQAIITQAVTKGVRGDRPMKDSGFEIVGDIPEAWEANKFGRCVRIMSNLVDPNLYLDYPQIAPDNIEKGSARLLDNVRTVKEVGVISWNHLFYKGQIIYSKIRPMLNKLTVAPYDGLCSADMYPIETECSTQFLVYLMLSDLFLAQVGLVTMNRVKMPKINQSELTNIKVPIPPIEEQLEIATYLDKKCSEIDCLLDKKEGYIDELDRYKKSLIYEYVTGKKEVPVGAV